VPKAKLYFGVVVLCMLGLLLGSCASEPSLEVRSAAEAVDVALSYLREHEPQNAPGAGISWQEEDITPKDEAGHPVPGAVHREFTSDEWTITVYYAVLPLERTVYHVVVSSIKLGWHWKGDVKADGSLVEVSAFRQMSEEESQNMAEEFLRNSATFVFDGIEDTLILADTLRARCPYCWVFIFEFDSEHSGYGGRTGKVLAEVITHHRAVIGVEQLEITSAVMDDQWDMRRHEIIGIEETLDVAELLANPVYDTLVRTHGVVSGLGEFFCPCFELTSGGEKIMVWYELMVEDDGTQRPPANKHEFDNGDRVIVIGELKGEGGTHYSKGDFWATDITYVFSAPPPELEIRLAPIHEVQVNIAESYPQQVIVYIKGGLSDGCTTFHELTTERKDNTINIEVTTQRPKDKECTAVYGYFEKNVNLGSEFISGETYTINVNDKTTDFMMQ